MNPAALCEFCDRPSVVGLGAPPMWLCQEDYDRELKRRLNAVKAPQALFVALVDQ